MNSMRGIRKYAAAAAVAALLALLWTGMVSAQSDGTMTITGTVHWDEERMKMPRVTRRCRSTGSTRQA